MKRRTFLSTTAGTLGVVIAGCAEEESTDREQGTSDGGDADGDGASDGSSDGSSENTNDGPVEILSHEWYNQGQFNTGVRGQIENTSGDSLSYVQVDVYFLDEEGVQFEESLDNTSELAADRVWEFDAMFLGDDPNRVDAYEVEATTTSF